MFFRLLESEVKHCENCTLRKEARLPVPGIGGNNYRFIIVGQNPGYQEDNMGRPFIGDSGQLLRDAFSRCDFILDKDAYVTNTCKCVKGETLIYLPDGSSERINKLVKDNYRGKVLSYDIENKRFIFANVLATHKTPLGNRQWLRISYKGAKKNGRGTVRIIVTDDHPILTREGWVLARDVEGKLINIGPQKFDKIAFEVAVGTLLGDSSIPKSTACIVCNHSFKQREWAKCKANIFGVSVKNYSIYDKKRKKSYCKVAYSTFSLRQIHWLREQFYVGGRKTVPNWLPKIISWRLLATLFLDDGCTFPIKGSKKFKAEIATCAFTEEECNIILKALLKLGLKGHIVGKSCKYKRIHFTWEETEKLLRGIAKYVPETLRYKLKSNDEKFPKYQEKLWRQRPIKAMYAKANMEIYKDDYHYSNGIALRNRTAYCLTVEGTNNFVTPIGVVHNCFSLKTPTKKHVAACFPFLEQEIRLLDKAEFVLLLGGTALQAFFPTKKITDSRGQLLTHQDFPSKKFFATFHPAAILRNKTNESFFFSDIQAFSYFVRNGAPRKQDAKYLVFKDNKKINKVLTKLSQQKLLSFDIETSGLDPFAEDFYISMISFSHRNCFGVAIPINHPEFKISSGNKELLKEILGNKEIKKVAHNAIFDIKCLKVHGFAVRGLVFDTMIGPYLQYPERRMPSLKSLAAEFTDMGHYEDELLQACGETKMSDKVFKTVPFNILGKYSAKDADATLRLYYIFKEAFDKSERLQKLMRTYIKVIYCVVDMERQGWVLLDENNAYKLLKKELKKIKEDIFDLSSVKKYLQDYADLNLNSSQQKAILLQQYGKIPLFKKTAKGAMAVDKEVLMTFADKSKLCRLLLNYSATSKLLTTYTKNLYALRSDDGRLRPNFNIALTATGRFSSSHPNIQNLPRATETAALIKKQFGCPKGYLLCEGDFSQQELRIYALYANDEIMLNAYRNQEDIHTRTASAIFSVPEKDVNKTQRMIGKTCNFALIYGISPPSLRARLLIDAGIRITEDEAKKFHSRFYKSYPALLVYHHQVERFVLKNGYIDTKFGFRRYLPAAASMDRREQQGAFRIAYNHPIQGTCAGILFDTLIRMRKVFRKTKANLLSTIHDSVFMYIPEDEQESYAQLMKETMEDMQYPWLKIPIPCEIKIGENWGSMEVMEL